MKKYYSLISILFIGIVIFFVSNFFYQLCFVEGNSMFPTLKHGDMLIVKKYNLDLKNKDVVLIKKNDFIIIKRLIGIPMDKIEIKDGYVFVNDKKFDNIYIENLGNFRNKLVLNKEEYFVLGDNRKDSIDSRYTEIGIIKKEQIIGKILFQNNNYD